MADEYAVQVAQLTSFGCEDLEVLMDRFIGDWEFYFSVLEEMLGDPGFDQLGESLQTGEVKPSFELAHMLKGIIANCGIQPMNDTIANIVEPLRLKNGSEGAMLSADEKTDLLAWYDKLMAQRRELVGLLFPSDSTAQEV